MAGKVGLKRRWFQNTSTPHYDLCKSKRAKAVELGAVEVDRKQTVELIKKWRTNGDKSKTKDVSPNR